VRRRGPRAASSEVENHPRGCEALERGGYSPEGASIPRARRSLARGGVGPSSEAETPRHGAWSSSETEVRPRGTATNRLVGRCGFLGRGPFFVPGRGHVERICDSRASLFMFYYFLKGVFSLVIRGPLWLSPTVAPEPLQWYPLGTRRGWRLLMRLSSLLVTVLFRGGALAHPWVYPLKPWRSVNAPARFFHNVLSVCEVLVSAGFGSVLAILGGVVCTYDIRLRSVHVQEV
jgi:hypothetical protein